MATPASPSRLMIPQYAAPHEAMLVARDHASMVNVAREANTLLDDDACCADPSKVSALSTVLIVLSGPLPPA